MFIKLKLFFLSLVTTLGLVWLTYAFTDSISTLTLLKNTQTKIEQVRKNSLSLRRNEKDFLLRNYGKYIFSHNKNFKLLDENMQSLENYMESLNIDFNKDITLIKKYFHIYNEYFNALAELMFKCISKQSLNDSASNLEILAIEMVDKNLQVGVLKLHELERNFLLTNDIVYLDEFKSHSDHILKEYPLTKEMQKELKRYIKAFIEISEYRKQIGLDENSGLKGVMRSNFHKAEDLLMKMNKSLKLKVDERIDDIIMNTIYNVAFIIVLTLLFTYILLYSIKQQINELKNKNKFIDTLFQSIPIPIFYKDMHGIYHDVNDAFTEVFGIEREKLVGKTVYDIAPKDLADEYKRYDEGLYENFKGGTQVYESLVNNPKTGNSHNVIFHKSLLFDIDDKPLGIIGAAIDITQLKQIQNELNLLNGELEQKVDREVEKNLKKELQLFESAKLAAMGGMIGNIIHQWKQPLNFISIIASNLKYQTECYEKTDNEKVIESMQDIIDAVNRLSDITMTFRNFLKEKKEFKKILLQERLDEALIISGTVLKDKGVELIKQIDYEDGIEIRTIPSELTEVIINIVNNAVDVIEEEKIIHAWVKVSLYKQNNNAVITIEDNAGGIPKSVMPYIFKEYFTTKDEDRGTGLGLYMSRKIVTESLKGKLYVKNSENGALFCIELPLS